MIDIEKFNDGELLVIQNNKYQKPLKNKLSFKIKCTKNDYYIDTIRNNDANEQINGLIIGRKEYGEVYFPNLANLYNLNIDDNVLFDHKLLTINSSSENNETCLNREAKVTLYNVFPNENNYNKLKKYGLTMLHYGQILKKSCENHQRKFEHYNVTTGKWTFWVNHFSRVGIDDDEECELIETNKSIKSVNEQKIDGAAKSEAAESSPSSNVSIALDDSQWSKNQRLSSPTSGISVLSSVKSINYSIDSINNETFYEETYKSPQYNYLDVNINKSSLKRFRDQIAVDDVIMDQELDKDFYLVEDKSDKDSTSSSNKNSSSISFDYNSFKKSKMNEFQKFGSINEELEDFDDERFRISRNVYNMKKDLFSNFDDKLNKDEKESLFGANMLSTSRYINSLQRKMNYDDDEYSMNQVNFIDENNLDDDHELYFFEKNENVNLSLLAARDLEKSLNRDAFKNRLKFQVKPEYCDDYDTIEIVTNKEIETIFKNKYVNLTDLSLSMGRTVRAGWNFKMDLLTVLSTRNLSKLPRNNKLIELNEYLSGRNDFSKTKLAIIKFSTILNDASLSDDSCMEIDLDEDSNELSLREMSKEDENQLFESSTRINQEILRSLDSSNEIFLNYLKENLEVELKNCKIENQQLPFIQPSLGPKSIHEHVSVLENFLKQIKNENVKNLIDYSYNIWKLFESLWGDDITLINEDPTSHFTAMKRRENLSDWLKNYINNHHQNLFEKNEVDISIILNHLLSFNLDKSCEACFNLGYPVLGTLISSVNSLSFSQTVMKNQVELWLSTNALNYFEKPLIKIYMMLAGILKLKTKTKEIIDLSENLHWIVVFGLHLWYLTAPNSLITEVVNNYENNFLKYNHPRPKPIWTDEVWFDDDDKYDLIYHLVKIFVDKTHLIEPILNPINQTNDPFDYHLSWFVMENLKALDYQHFRNKTEFMVHTRFANQLEREGLWHWSVFVLLHIKDFSVREKVVIDLLTRHIEVDQTSIFDQNNVDFIPLQDEDYLNKELFLMNDLKIPRRYVMLAKAYKSLSIYNYVNAVGYLLAADQINLAQKLFWKHVAPKEIFNRNFDYVSTVIKQICLRYIPDHLGLMLLYIIEEMNNILNVIDNDDDDRLEIYSHYVFLRALLTEMCQSLQRFPVTNNAEQFMIAELSKIICSFIKKLTMHVKAKNPAIVFDTVYRLASKLPLMPDYKFEELDDFMKMLTSLFSDTPFLD